MTSVSSTSNPTSATLTPTYTTLNEIRFGDIVNIGPNSTVHATQKFGISSNIPLNSKRIGTPFYDQVNSRVFYYELSGGILLLHCYSIDSIGKILQSYAPVNIAFGLSLDISSAQITTQCIYSNDSVVYPELYTIGIQDANVNSYTRFTQVVFVGGLMQVLGAVNFSALAPNSQHTNRFTLQYNPAAHNISILYVDADNNLLLATMSCDAINTVLYHFDIPLSPIKCTMSGCPVIFNPSYTTNSGASILLCLKDSVIVTVSNTDATTIPTVITITSDATRISVAGCSMLGDTSAIAVAGWDGTQTIIDMFSISDSNIYFYLRCASGVISSAPLGIFSRSNELLVTQYETFENTLRYSIMFYPIKNGVPTAGNNFITPQIYNPISVSYVNQAGPVVYGLNTSYITAFVMGVQDEVFNMQSMGSIFPTTDQNYWHGVAIEDGKINQKIKILLRGALFNTAPRVKFSASQIGALLYIRPNSSAAFPNNLTTEAAGNKAFGNVLSESTVQLVSL